MHGAEDHATHRTKQPLGMQKSAIHALGIFHIGIFRLLGERVVLQPRQQFQIHRHTLVVHLRSMHVHIVHGRNQQLVAKVDNLRTLNIDH